MNEEEQISGTVYMEPVVIKRSEDPYYRLSQDKRISPWFKTILKSYYDIHAFEKPVMERFREVYQTAGRPKIEPNTDGFKDNINRAHEHGRIFRPNLIHASNFDEVVHELSHDLQRKYGNNNGFIEKIKAFPSYNADIDPRGSSRYDYPDRVEGETHTDFQPLIKSYILEGTLPSRKYIQTLRTPQNYETGMEFSKALRNTYKYNEANNLKQVLDSAQSYNKQRQVQFKRTGIVPYKKQGGIFKWYRPTI